MKPNKTLIFLVVVILFVVVYCYASRHYREYEKSNFDRKKKILGTVTPEIYLVLQNVPSSGSLNFLSSVLIVLFLYVPLATLQFEIKC
jgi:heme/copper-type cytochrome/quinol oxidase subunit 2